jgi:cysteine desulfurase
MSPDQTDVSLLSKKLLAESREKTAALLGAKPDEIVFTGSGSESDHIALIGTWESAAKWNSRKKRIVVTGVEHPAVRKTVKALEDKGADVAWVPPGPGGRFASSTVTGLSGNGQSERSSGSMG